MAEQGPPNSSLRKVHVTGGVTPSVQPATSFSADSAGQAERLSAEVRAAAAALLTEAARLETTLLDGTQKQAAEFRASSNSRVALDKSRMDADLAALEAESVERATSWTDDLGGAVEQLAPGAAGTAWDAVLPPTAAAGPPSAYLRFGTITEPSTAGAPAALAPLLNRSGWMLSGQVDRTMALVQSALTRIVAQVPVKHLRLIVFDPKVEGRLGMFARLRAVNASSFPAPATNADDLRTALADAVTSAAVNGEAISAAGASDLAELWSHDDAPQGDYSVVVVLNYPAGLDRISHAALAQLAESGPSRGVSLIVQEDPAAHPGDGVVPADLTRHLTSLRLDGGLWSSTVLPAGVVVADDGPPSRIAIDAVVEGAIAAATSDVGPSIRLEELVATDIWSESSAESIDAVIGRAGRAPLILSLRTENPPHPNMLVGGAVGQGKSNLLLDMIFSLASRYSPDELELVLLDFKEGLEFQRFDRDESGDNWLPHVRVLSLESNKPFGLAVLDYVAAEMSRRSGILKESKANSINDFRRKTGQRMSRLLLVIDEFHVLFEGDDEPTADAVARLELIAKQGRALGIHLLLATQSLSGISGLRVKGDSIFAQFPIRVSLKNTVDESQALLSRDNKAAADLTYRGELIVNRNFGLDPANSNVRGIAAYADPEFTRAQQEALWARDPAPRPPLVFLGRSFAKWPVNRFEGIGARTDTLEAWFGMPIAITDEPAAVELTRDVDQAIAVVGQGDDELAATLTSIAATLSRGMPEGSRLIVLDGEPADRTAWLAPIIEDAERRGITVERVDRSGVAAYLLERLLPELPVTSGPTTLVLGLGLQRIPDLNDEHLVDPEDPYGDRISAALVLSRLATRGAIGGRFFVGHWSNARTLTETLGHNHDGIGVYALLSVGLDEFRDILGPYATKPEGSPRVTLFDRRTGGAERTVVPFEPGGMP